MLRQILLLVCLIQISPFILGNEFSKDHQKQNPHAEFAGIWFYSTIQQDSTQKQFPVGYIYGPSSSNEVGKDKISCLHSKMKTALLKEQKKGGARILDYISTDSERDFSNSAADNSIVFACALNYEHVEVQYVSGIGVDYSKVLAEIGFDLVICNFKDRRILTILPARIVGIDAVQGRASDQKKHSMLLHLYEDKLIPQFVKLAQSPYSSAMASKTIGIGELRIDHKALSYVPENYKNLEKKGYTTYFSSLISSSFYSAIKVPILPYSGGGDKIFYVMSERIKDTSRITDATMLDNQGESTKDFLLKKPDYTINIVIPGFMEHPLQSNQFQKQVAFIAYSGFRLNKDKKEVYSQKFKEAVTSTYPVNICLSSPWINYEDSMIKMFRNVALSLKQNKKTRSIIEQTSIK